MCRAYCMQYVLYRGYHRSANSISCLIRKPPALAGCPGCLLRKPPLDMPQEEGLFQASDCDARLGAPVQRRLRLGVLELLLLRPAVSTAPCGKVRPKE